MRIGRTRWRKDRYMPGMDLYSLVMDVAGSGKGVVVGV